MTPRRSPTGSRMPAVRRAGPGRLRIVAGAALVLLLTVVAYLPSRHGGFTLDDDLLLTDSALIKAPDGLYRFWFTAEPVDYWPVGHSSLWVEWRLWGTDPTGYRVTNVLLHGLNALLIWAVLDRVGVPGAFFAALLFAVHPVNVQSVAWIAQRKTLLATLFFLLAVLAYLAFERATVRERTGARSAAWYALALAAFVLAMLSKASVAILPLVLLALVASARSPTLRDVWRMVPFVVVSLVLIVVTMRFQARAIDSALDAGGAVERVLGAAAALWFYLGKAVLPVHLSFVYPRWRIRPEQWVWWVPLLAALAVSALVWRYRRGWSRSLLLAWAYYVVALIPVMGFTSSVYMTEQSLVADDYQYLALIGVVALAAAGWAAWARRARRTTWVPLAAAATIVAALVLLTWRQSALYSDSVTLFRASAEQHPDSAQAHHNLGFILVRFGRVKEGIAEYEEALRIDPDSAQTHHDLGAALAADGRRGDGIEHLERALVLRPDDAAIENDLGALLRETGRPQEAIAHLQRAVQLAPALPEARCNLGKALLQVGRAPDAVDELRVALRLRPDDAGVHSLLDVVLSETGGNPPD